MFVTNGDSMALYETTVTEHTDVRIRVHANSKEEAELIFQKFEEKDNDYIYEEIDLSSKRSICHSEFKEVHPPVWDEVATITEYDDGTFDAEYEGGEE